jgi:hypothetical protein
MSSIHDKIKLSHSHLSGEKGPHAVQKHEQKVNSLKIPVQIPPKREISSRKFMSVLKTLKDGGHTLFYQRIGICIKKNPREIIYIVLTCSKKEKKEKR